MESRIGETCTSSYGQEMKIIKYEGGYNYTILFEDGYIHSGARYDDFKKGQVRNPYFITSFGVGYLGEGEYKTANEHGATIEYTTWRAMLSRCYNKNPKKSHMSYMQCSVCDEWHNFQNFAKWYHNNYYEVDDYRMCIDKDILFKNNKIYSPETCIFVPDRINNLFVKPRVNKKDLPVGVHRRGKKYIAQMNMISNKGYIGMYATIEEAFNAYKNKKENYIKEVADEYKDKIPQKLYDALYRYKVEVDD